ncbi:MAG: Ku protein [Acidothermus sp.]|nr:Ku protein [Acidothermus sp.]
MRAIWKGAISFGLVSIAVNLYPATQERDVAFHQVHRTDGGRIRYRRICSRCGNEVEYADIAKGYELPDGEMVVLTDDDLAELPLSTSREIEVLEFVPLEQVDPIYFSKSYYLEPDAKARKAYVLLRDALEKSGKVGIVKIALRRRESLATLRIRDGVLVLETMLWPDEIREADFDFLQDAPAVRSQEIAMAESLIESMSGDFDPSRYHDDYREALEKVIEAKIAGREVVAAEGERKAAAGNVVDLVAALRASVEAARKEREGGSRSPTRAAAKSASSASRKKAQPPDEEAKSAASGRRRRATTASSEEAPATRRSTARRRSA